jgi:outer membrane immunogenic protein
MMLKFGRENPNQGPSMKKLWLAGVSSIAIIAASSAHAADVGARPVYKAAPLVAPIPAYSWTGCYIGAHAGWAWEKSQVEERSFRRSIGISGATRTSLADLDTSGAMLGGQIGCDYQFASNLLLGIEGDLAWTHLRRDVHDPSGDSTDLSDRGNVLRFDKQWLSSVTGRLGFAALPRTLLYVKGGGAWAHDSFDFTHADIVGLRGIFDQTRTGWTVGGGVEWAFTPNWSVFAEYDHYDFGTKNVVTHFGPFAGDFDRFDVKQRVDTVKFGVNYRFNLFGPRPIVARH